MIISDLLPPFNTDGLLPAGDYHLTFTELRRSILVTGPGNQYVHSNWDSNWRLWLVDQLALMAEQLWLVGIDEIFLNGSFVEDKDHPNDIDGYFVCDRADFVSGQLQEALNVLDPQKVWTWDPKSRRPYRHYPKKQLPMWHVYRVELYPHFAGLGSGIRDRWGNELEFPAAFRTCRRNSQPKGIVQLIRERKR